MPTTIDVLDFLRSHLWSSTSLHLLADFSSWQLEQNLRADVDVDRERMHVQTVVY